MKHLPSLALAAGLALSVLTPVPASAAEKLSEQASYRAGREAAMSRPETTRTGAQESREGTATPGRRDSTP